MLVSFLTELSSVLSDATREKVQVLHILQVKCEGLSNIARGNQEDCWMLPDKAFLGVER
jgi:hypothetical protein